MTKIGRPKKRKGEKLRNAITPRFNDEELIRIERAVESRGLTPAQWLRMLALEKLAMFLVVFLAACSSSGPSVAQSAGTDDLAVPIGAADLADAQVVDMAHAGAVADLAHAASAPDLLPPPDLAPIECVLTSGECQVDAQCCSNNGAAGSCFFGSSSGIANCCKPHGHVCVLGDTIYSCCPNSQCIVTSGQTGTCS